MSKIITALNAGDLLRANSLTYPERVLFYGIGVYEEDCVVAETGKKCLKGEPYIYQLDNHPKRFESRFNRSQLIFNRDVVVINGWKVQFSTQENFMDAGVNYF